jgi:hypothetical protein
MASAMAVDLASSESSTRVRTKSAPFGQRELREPIRLNREFGLMVSLEVAEPPPAEGTGIFVDSLTKLGSKIECFAAKLFQEGTLHIDKQWPKFWRKHSPENEHVMIDWLRSKLWQNENVDWWYDQNALVIVGQDRLECYPLLKDAPKKHLSFNSPRLIRGSIWRGS